VYRIADAVQQGDARPPRLDLAQPPDGRVGVELGAVPLRELVEPVPVCVEPGPQFGARRDVLQPQRERRASLVTPRGHKRSTSTRKPSAGVRLVVDLFDHHLWGANARSTP